jgi:site-specific recombinase XerD
MKGIKNLHMKGQSYYYVRHEGKQAIWIALHTKERRKAIKLWAILEGNPNMQSIAKTVGVETITFSGLCDKFIESIKGRSAPNTLRSYARGLDALKDKFGKLTIDKIERTKVITYHKGMSDRPYEANLHVRILSVVMQYALDLGLITHNPVFRLKKFRERKIELKLTVETLFGKIYPAAEPMLQRAIMLAFHLVQHENEVKNMRWDNFSDAGSVRFTRAKTTQPITIDFSSNKAFSRFIDSILLDKEAKSPYLVYRQSKTGKYEPYKTFSGMWTKALIASGLGKGVFMFKEIRHLANTFLKDNGVGADQRCKMTGHASISTNEHYTHETGQDTIEAGRVLGEAGGS